MLRFSSPQRGSPKLAQGGATQSRNPGTTVCVNSRSPERGGTNQPLNGHDHARGHILNSLCPAAVRPDKGKPADAPAVFTWRHAQLSPEKLQHALWVIETGQFRDAGQREIRIAQQFLCT